MELEAALNIQVADRMRFRFVWAISSTALRYSFFTGRRFTLPSAGPQASTHLTLVARLPRHVTAPIEQVVTSLGEAALHHYFYPADTIHLTIQNLDWIVRDVDNLERARERLRAVVGLFLPIKMVVAGLGVSPYTAFVQIFPADESLANLRREIRAMRVRGPISSQEVASTKDISAAHRPRWLFGNMAFANVVRFAGKVTPLLIREIAGHRWQYFGEFVLDTLELVVTDRLLSAEGTQIRDRLVLRGASTDTKVRR